MQRPPRLEVPSDPISSTGVTPSSTAPLNPTPSTSEAPSNEVITVKFGEAEATAPKHTRQAWGSRLSFLLASIGAALGFGNFFRFPYLTYKSGGGAFLIPYFISLVIIGFPVLLLELAIGQVYRRSSIHAMQHAHKRTGGVGAAAVLFGSFIISTYYSVIVSWVFVYVYYTFSWDLPWKGNAERFYLETVLQANQASHALDFGAGISWPVFVSLALVWAVVYICVWRGVKGTGLIAFITVPLPYVILVVFVIQGFILEGGLSTGIYYYLKPDFSLLLDPNIWLSASGQVFFSLGISSGIMTAYGSFNNPQQNIVLDNLIICIADSGFSLLAGFAVFGILGHLAFKTNVPIDKVTKSGLGLAFVAFPDAITYLPVSHLWAFLLWLIMFLMGIDSAFALTESSASVIHDFFPKLPIALTTLITCLLGFVLGIPFTFRCGNMLMDIIDHYVSDYCLIIIAIAECIVMGYMAASYSLIPSIKQFIEKTPSKLKIAGFIIQSFLTHSIGEFRHKINKVAGLKRCHLNFFSFDLYVKFVAPCILAVIFVLSFVNEITEQAKGLNWISITIGIVLISLCFLVIGFFFFFPIGYHSVLEEQKQEKERELKEKELEMQEHQKQLEQLEQQFEAKKQEVDEELHEVIDVNETNTSTLHHRTAPASADIHQKETERVTEGILQQAEATIKF